MYTVQVASFKEVNQAKTLVDQLIKEKYDAYIAPIDMQNNKGWYRVCIGESTDRAQAQEKLENLKTKFKGSFVQAF